MSTDIVRKKPSSVTPGIEMTRAPAFCACTLAEECVSEYVV